MGLAMYSNGFAGTVASSTEKARESSLNFSTRKSYGEKSCQAFKYVVWGLHPRSFSCSQKAIGRQNNFFKTCPEIMQAKSRCLFINFLRCMFISFICLEKNYTA